MERRGQQPEDAEPPSKDGAGGLPTPPPPFLEVTCRSSGKVRRFAAGTTARYALHAINRKLEPGAPPALHVEAVRDDGEEPVSFGPSAALADYGRGWRLQTVTAHDAPGIHHAPPHADTVRDDFLVVNGVTRRLPMIRLPGRRRGALQSTSPRSCWRSCSSSCSADCSRTCSRCSPTCFRLNRRLNLCRTNPLAAACSLDDRCIIPATFPHFPIKIVCSLVS
ncbi:unnamed protein product [Urochloa decumbens]|uniref:Uncharacterized protein n=1 Tax=Urochloa decumbens TaxID=240449 RepID=A0ABC8Y2R0_9POAL